MNEYLYESYEHHELEWHGRLITIYYKSPYINIPVNAEGHTIVHLVITSSSRTPLPISETGYKSYFTTNADVDTLGGPVQYGKAWLDHASRSREWQLFKAKSGQLTLFNLKEPKL